MMGPKIIIIFFFLFMLINTRVFAQAPDVGKIFIGTQGNRTDPTEYRFNKNAQSASLSIPFSAKVFQEDGTEVSKDDEIEVFCVNEFSSTTGYTQLDFTIENLPAAFPEGQAEYGLTEVGRAAVVRCYGISRNFQCPATTNLTVRQPEFCRETSMSDPVTITMTPAPVVSICERVSRVPSFTTNTYDGTFQVVLSEAVGIANVTVTCTQVSPQDLDYCQQPGVSCCQSSNQIDIRQVQVPEGGTTATMSYTVTRSSGRDVCVGVRCSANSVTRLPEGYFQYTTSDSSDSSSQGLFQTVTPDVYMEPQYLTIYNTSFQSVLYLDASVDVPIQCQASVVNTLEEALDRTVPSNIDCTFIFGNATTTTTITTTAAPTTTTTPAATTTDVNATTGPSTPPPTTTPLPTPPIDPSSPWITVDNSFTITAQNKFHVVQTSRELLVIAPTQEIVVTTCCSTVTNVNSNHWDLKVATVAVAELKPRLNTTGGATSGTAGEERFVVNPAYREVAPCPCDFTYLVCDINCCCDAECTDPEKETFSGCIPGRPGGQDADPDLRSCKSDHFPKDDWFPLLCVQFESNALLGSFYTKADKLNTAAAVTAKLAEENKQNVFTYRETESRFSDLSVVSGYTEGSNILTIYPQGGNLLLPQPSSSGYCLDSTPVKFLHDSDSTCTRTLTPETCADLTPFSAHVYVQPSSLFNPACPRSFAVSSTGRDLQDEAQRVNVQVNYLCADDVSMYIKNVSSRFSEFVSSGTVSSFPSVLQNANCTDLCGADSLCLGYNQGLDDSSSGGLPPRCTLDNSFELLSVPTYSAATRTCQNVVLDVRYRFSWAGQSITGFTADVVLGNVVLPSAGGDGASVSQRFSAVFTNDYSGPFNQSDNYQNVDTPYQRSGKPGYDFGKPVATGCNSTNGTSGASSIDQSEVSQMAVWSPGQDGLCENAKRRFLTFGDDMQSSCVLRQTFNDINNCDSLKTLVLNHLNVLMPANAIGRYGYNDPDNNDMWIEILREDPFSTTTDSGPTDTSTVTPGPTSASTITPDLANASTVTAGPTSATIATTGMPVVPENTTFDPLSVRSGVCQNIVSGIHLEIMYAETGRSYNYPLLEIIGAAVRYSVSNWSMSCVGPNAVRCQNNSAFSQTFLVTSSVQYTKVSPTTPHQPILFYQIHNKESCDSDTCYRFFEDFDTSICHHDTCWHELFYPLTQGYQGYEGVNYTRGFSLVIALFILGYVSVTKPWK